VPAAVGGNLELEAERPKTGSSLKWTVRAGDRVLAQESDALKAPLQSNEAFFLKYEADDLATASPEES